MPSSRISVISIAKHSLQYGEVIVDDIPHKLHTVTIPLGRISLEMAFTKALSRIHEDRFSLLLDDDMASLFPCAIPLSTPQEKETSAIEDCLKNSEPDITHSVWGYHVFKETNLHKEIVVVRPAKKISHDIGAPLTVHSKNVMAVDTISHARTRHDDPFVGIALEQKHDHPSPVAYPPDEPTSAVKPHAHIRKRRLGTILAVIAVCISGFFSYSFFMKKPEPAVDSDNISQMPSPPFSPTQVPEDIVDTETLAIQILNGSGVKGASSHVEEILKQEGFTNTTVGNANSFSYGTTLIQTKNDTPPAIAEKLTSMLENYTVEIGQPLPDESTYDIVIIVGKQRSREGE